MARAEGPLLPRRRLGAELKALRGQRTLEQVAAETLISTSKLSRLENGQGIPQLRDIRDLIEFYEVGGQAADRLRRWTAAGRRQAWWKEYTNVDMPGGLDTYVEFESGASVIRTYTLSLVPGLMQTPRYTTQLMRALAPGLPADQLAQLVELRQQRQRIFFDPESSGRLHVVLDESALRRRLEPEGESRRQLELILELTRSRRASLRIVPFSAGVHGGLNGMFTVFQFADDIDRDVVSVEGQAGERFLEEESSVLDYLRRFDAVSQAALDTGESRDFLTSLLSDLTPPKDAE